MSTDFPAMVRPITDTMEQRIRRCVLSYQEADEVMDYIRELEKIAADWVAEMERQRVVDQQFVDAVRREYSQPFIGWSRP